jgi:bacterioferritin
MSETRAAITRKTLIALLSEDLSREFRAVSAYVVYSQTFKGAQHTSVTKELHEHAGQGLQHALTIAKQIAHLGGTPTPVPREVMTSARAEAMLQFDLDNQGETIIHYRERVGQCEALGEEGIAEEIRGILRIEEARQADLAAALTAPNSNVNNVPQLSRKQPPGGRSPAPVPNETDDSRPGA